MPFTPATLSFLRGLARNNRKPWFEAHCDAYEAAVVARMHELLPRGTGARARLAKGKVTVIGGLSR